MPISRRTARMKKSFHVQPANSSFYATTTKTPNTAGNVVSGFLARGILVSIVAKSHEANPDTNVSQHKW
jgi:hypothetical protein